MHIAHRNCQHLLKSASSSVVVVSVKMKMKMVVVVMEMHCGTTEEQSPPKAPANLKCAVI